MAFLFFFLVYAEHQQRIAKVINENFIQLNQGVHRKGAARRYISNIPKQDNTYFKVRVGQFSLKKCIIG